jgi:hypothetical protein
LSQHPAPAKRTIRRKRIIAATLLFVGFVLFNVGFFTDYVFPLFLGLGALFIGAIWLDKLLGTTPPRP